VPFLFRCSPNPSYTRANTNRGLPSDSITALALGQDGSLWVGTGGEFGGGLARLDREGRWQSYTRANTNRGLASDSITALVLGQDGSLWIGTSGGISRFSPPSRTMVQITDVLGQTGDVSQAEETVAVVAFDATYLTQPGMFHYAWSLSEAASKQPSASETITRSPFHQVQFNHEGTYWLSVAAIDLHGNRSDAKLIRYHFTPLRPPSLLDKVISAWQVIAVMLTSLYGLAFVVLLLLTRRYAWAFRVNL
jgi:hypothetical protein